MFQNLARMYCLNNFLSTCLNLICEKLLAVLRFSSKKYGQFISLSDMVHQTITISLDFTLETPA